jgi:hypothetical protein
MTTKQLLIRTLAGIGWVVILAGCTGAGVPAPTLDVQPTLIAVKSLSAQTVVAGLTQSAPSATAPKPTASVPAVTATPPAPTATPTVVTATPTLTLTPTPTIKPTATYVIWTRTPTSSAWSCAITESLPRLNATLRPREDFDAYWMFTNTGTEKWYASDIDIRYVSGVKFQTKVDSVDLPNDVSTSGTALVRIDMLAPSDPGQYTAIWELASSERVICAMGITIIVR